MSGILFLAIVVLGFVLAAQGRRLRALDRRIDELEHRHRVAPREPLPVQPAPLRDSAPPLEITKSSPPARLDRPPEPPEPPNEAPDEPARPSLESLIGARLPVWIGAVALVAAGFFLVRHSIEIGLLGPGVRTILAALFAALLIGASEAARRVPPLRDDPRIAQALAGAGIASAYGTLYVAAAIYRFVAPLPAFGLMVAVTAIGLVLALRHGPPTAVLALAGGFVAPLVAGYDAAGIGPLLAYLALFTTALFGLAIHRGWGWLAIAATVAGFGWVNFLLFALADASLAAPAGFVLFLAISATLALPRAGVAALWLRVAPVIAGLVQLLAFAPALEFDGLVWSFYLTLAAAALLLAWRDARHLPGALAALALALVLLATGLVASDRGATLLAAPCIAALFASPGLVLLNRGRAWAILALGGIAGPIMLAHLLAPGQLESWQWALIEFVAAGLAAWVSWRRRDAIDAIDPGLVGGALAAAMLAAVGAGQLLDSSLIAIPVALATLALGLWARRVADRALFTLPTLGFAAMAVAGLRPIADYVLLVAESATGELLPFTDLPLLAEALKALLPIVLAVAILAPDRRQFGRMRAGVLGFAVAIGLMLLYHLAKLPFAIGDETRFVRWGFGERALVTQSLFVAAVLLQGRGKFDTLAATLFGLAVARLVWFDLLILNPVFVAQQVGTIPLFNAAVLHAALAAFWCWRFLRTPYDVRSAVALSLLATLAAVRQAAQGSTLVGQIGTGENYGYSAALLLLALAWLSIGIRRGGRDLRLAGLGLLTLVTLKVFLVDAAALDGLLRILSFLGLGLALIGIGWVYTRFLAARPKASVAGG